MAPKRRSGRSLLPCREGLGYPRGLRMTADPEITGSLGEFETCPDWVPVMDMGQQFAWIALKTMGEHGFDQRTNRVAKVRNVPNVGSRNEGRGSRSFLCTCAIMLLCELDR